MYKIYEEILKEKNITTADVCKATGISQSTMSNWKKRKNDLTIKNARLVSDYLGVTIDYLVTGKNRQMDYDENDNEMMQIIEFMRTNPSHRNIFKLVCKIKKQDIQLVESLFEKMV